VRGNTRPSPEGYLELVMFLGLTIILFNTAHTSGSPDWTGTRRHMSCWEQICAQSVSIFRDDEEEEKFS
jgi:hypothetical protein